MRPDDMEPPLDLSRLAPPAEVPRDLESRVAGSLRARGLLHRKSTGEGAWWRHGVTALAAAALLAVGVAVGERSAETPVTTGARYLLLLYQDSADSALGASQRDSIVAEYVRWAAGLREQDLLVLGEELSDEMAIVPEARAGPGSGRTATPAGASLGGFFVIRANDFAHAVEIARETPHARGGGFVVVRPINAT